MRMKATLMILLLLVVGCAQEIPTEPEHQTNDRVVPEIYKVNGRPVFTVMGGTEDVSFYVDDDGEIVIVDSGPKIMIGGGPVPVADNGNEHIAEGN